MYVTLFVILVAMVWAISGLTQQSGTETGRPKFDRHRRRMELREQMHKRMRDQLLYGQGANGDTFRDMDRLMEEAMKDSFSGFDDIAVEGSASYQSEWIESTSSKTLVITPKDESQKLDIDVKATLITIKGKTEHRDQNSTSYSEFSNVFPVPADCDGSRVKMTQKDGKILIELPYRSAPKTVVTPPKKEVEERKPIKNLDGQISI
jgi:HSP20 family molecular chaperone IbpA